MRVACGCASLPSLPLPSPPIGHGNFAEPPAVYRGPYEYSEPGAPRDFTPQFEREAI